MGDRKKSKMDIMPRGHMVIDALELSVGYKSADSINCVCSGMNVELHSGELTALIGRNGQGKSTIIRSLVGLQPHLSGKINLLGKPLPKYSIKERARLISYVATDTVKVGHLKVRDLVEMGRYPYTNWMGGLSQHDKEQVENSLHLVGMESFRDKYVAKLSDGERQRIMVARCLAQDTPVIILDEPTAFLDLPNKYELLLLLKKLAHEQNKCILFSTHDITTTFQIVDQLWIVHDCKLHSGGVEELIQAGAIQLMLEGSNLLFDENSKTFRHTNS